MRKREWDNYLASFLCLSIFWGPTSGWHQPPKAWSCGCVHKPGSEDPMCCWPASHHLWGEMQGLLFVLKALWVMVTLPSFLGQEIYKWDTVVQILFILIHRTQKWKKLVSNTPEKWSFMLEKKKVTQLPWHFLPSASAAIGMQLAA